MLFVSALHGGGAERVASNLANRWDAGGHAVRIVNLANPTAGDYRIEGGVERASLGLADESRHLPGAILGNLRRLRALRAEVRRHAPDVLLAFMTSSNVLAILAAAGTATRVIVSERCHPPNTDAARHWLWLRDRLYRRADAVVVLAEKSREWIRAHTGAERVAVIPNFLAWPLARHPGVVAPPHVSGLRLLAVGRLVAEKGYPLLLDAFSHVASEYPDWHLSIVGGGDADALRALARELGLERRVSFEGGVGNVGDWYAAADAYVMSSVSEGFPNSLVEAMASGLAVASFDCDTGPGDIIEHDVNGLLVPAEDVAALAATLRRLLGDPELRARLAARAPTVLERYAPERVSARWDTLLGEVAPSPARPAVAR